MSLVAYGSSSDEEEEDEAPESDKGVQVLVQKTKTVLTLPTPKHADETSPNPRLDRVEDAQVKMVKDSGNTATDQLKLFKNLPKPKHLEIDPEDDVVPTSEEPKLSQEKPLRKNRGPVKISLPSLSEVSSVFLVQRFIFNHWSVILYNLFFFSLKTSMRRQRKGRRHV